MNSISNELALPLPQSLDTERALLGALLVNSALLNKTNELLTPDQFILGAHRRIFETMLRLAAEGQFIELVTLCHVLRDDTELRALGGAAYIAGLSDGVHHKPPIAHWAKIISDAASLRSVVHAGESMIRAALEPHAKVDDVLEMLRTILGSFDTSSKSAGTSLVAVSVEELLRRQIKPREMLLDPIVPEQGLVIRTISRSLSQPSSQCSNLIQERQPSMAIERLCRFQGTLKSADRDRAILQIDIR